jgi:hypothetical protein
VKGRCALLALLAVACGKSTLDHSDAASPTAPNLVAVAASGPTAPSAPASARAAVAWRGSYKSTAGELFIPPDWKSVHWNVKETTAGIGEGSIALTVDAASGRVQGAMEGPLGPAIVDGLASDGKLTATIVRKDPTDKGFTGTLVASVGSDRAEGTMRVSLAEASAVRAVMFTLSPDGAQPATR